MNAFIDFLDDGTFQAVHTELLGADFLFDLGTADVARASVVEFNDTTRQWEVRWIGDPEDIPARFSNVSRASCIEWEVGELSKDLGSVVSKLIPRRDCAFAKNTAEGSPQTIHSP